MEASSKMIGANRYKLVCQGKNSIGYTYSVLFFLPKEKFDLQQSFCISKKGKIEMSLNN